MFELSREKKEIGERVRAVEVKVDGLGERMDRFEDYCKETQAVYRESFADLNARMEKFLTNEIHDLESAIQDAKDTKRESLSNWDWTKILIAIVTVVGSIVIALAQYGLLA